VGYWSKSRESLLPAIRVLIADDHAIVREALETALMLADGMEMVGQAASGKEAIALATSLVPDVIILDLRLGDMDGVEVLNQILAERSDARVLMLTSFDAENDVVRAIEAGARGYLLKGSSSAEVIQAVHMVHAGGSAIESSVASKLFHHVSSGAAGGDDSNILTPRELEVIRIIARGSSNQRVGEALNITEGTVKTHVSHILEKLEAGDRTEAVVKALQMGLLDL